MSRSERRRRQIQQLQQQQITAAQQAPGATVTVQATTFVGPLPAPQILGEYEQLIPGSADRLLTDFENQSTHRRHMERIIVWADVVRAQSGLFIGGAVALYLIWTGGMLLRSGHDLSGFAAIGVAIATAVGPFIIRSRQQMLERMAQQQALPAKKKR